MNPTPRLRSLFAAAVLALPAATPALAADFPNGPVRLVHGMPGGIVDTGARAVADLLSARWKQPVIVDGRPGANEMLATDTVARAPKDGQTLLVATESAMVNNGVIYRKPLADAQRDLVPVQALFELPFALIVRADLGVNTVAEFVALMKAEGKRHSYASSGVGSPLQLAMEGFAREAGFEMLHVPYKTLGQLQQDMMGGTLDAAFFGVNSALPFVKTGKLKILAVTSPVRVKNAPGVPTFAELGYRQVDYQTLVALLAPRGLPAPTLARISADVREVLQSEDFAKRFLVPQEVKPGTAGGQELAGQLDQRRTATRRLVQSLSIQLE